MEATWMDRADADENDEGQMAVYFERFSRYLHAIAEGLDDVYEGHEYDDATDAIAELAMIQTFLEEQEPQLVDRAREEGLAWAKIGEALGITRQAAWERFA